MGYADDALRSMQATGRTGDSKKRHELLLGAQVYALLDLAAAIREQSKPSTVVAQGNWPPQWAPGTVVS